MFAPEGRGQVLPSVGFEFWGSVNSTMSRSIRGLSA
jgi:hypothetical protein